MEMLGCLVLTAVTIAKRCVECYEVVVSPPVLRSDQCDEDAGAVRGLTDIYAALIVGHSLVFRASFLALLTIAVLYKSVPELEFHAFGRFTGSMCSRYSRDRYLFGFI